MLFVKPQPLSQSFCFFQLSASKCVQVSIDFCELILSYFMSIFGTSVGFNFFCQTAVLAQTKAKGLGVDFIFPSSQQQ